MYLHTHTSYIIHSDSRVVVLLIAIIVAVVLVFILMFILSITSTWLKVHWGVENCRFCTSNLGGTAIGTGIAADPHFSQVAVQERSGWCFWCKVKIWCHQCVCVWKHLGTWCYFLFKVQQGAGEGGGGSPANEDTPPHPVKTYLLFR